jgi:hypothetical protein
VPRAALATHGVAATDTAVRRFEHTPAQHLAHDEAGKG